MFVSVCQELYGSLVRDRCGQLMESGRWGVRDGKIRQNCFRLVMVVASGTKVKSQQTLLSENCEISTFNLNMFPNIPI